MQRILLIETSSTLRHVLGKSIKGHNFSVHSLSDFAEAVAQLSEVGE